MVSLILGTALVVLVATGLGRGLMRIAGWRSGFWLAPAVGGALALSVAPALTRLPGHGTTAGAILGVGAICGALWARPRPAAGRWAEACAITTLALGAACVPFVIAGDSGALGASINDDLAFHFALVDDIASGRAARTASTLEGYPIGPHAVGASVAGPLQLDVGLGFTTLLLATPAWVALAARAALGELALGRRIVCSVLVGLAYLSAAYFAQGAYKEPLGALLLLAFAVSVRELLLSHGSGASARRAVVPGTLVGGFVATYGPPGFAIPAFGLGIGLLAMLAIARRRPLLADLRRLAAPLAIGAGVVMLLALPQASRFIVFTPVGAAAPPGSTNPGGNFLGQISWYEVLSMWWSADFRIAPPEVFHAGMAAAVGVAISLFSLGWWWRQRDVIVPSTVIAALLAYGYLRETELPYVSAKTLVVAAPLLMVMNLRALLEGVEWPPLSWTKALRLFGAASLCALAAYSAILVLVNARVGHQSRSAELAAFRDLTEGHPTLFLGRDAFASERLGHARAAYAVPYSIPSMISFDARTDKPIVPSTAADFDSIEPASLRRFRFVITPRSAILSMPPRGWRQVASTASYALFERRRTSGWHAILPEGGEGGTTLDCSTPAGRQLSRLSGLASVRPRPIVLPGSEWRVGTGPATVDGNGFAIVSTGRTARQPVALPAGRWQLSLQYQSPTDVTVDVGGRTTTVPSTLAIIGDYWRVTDVEGGRTLQLVATVAARPLEAASALIGRAAFVRVPAKRSLMPLRAACGRYVDAYRLK